MRIVRTPRTARFTVLSNDLLEDENLSFKARGLLAYLLSRPDGWHTDARQLAEHSTDGRTAVLSGLRELEEAGYLIRQQCRDEKGQFYSYCEIRDEPTGVRFPDSGEADSREPDSYTKNGTKELKTPPVPPKLNGHTQEALDGFFTATDDGWAETVAPSRPEPGSDADPGFVAFWSAYPRHVAKGSARKAYRAALRKGVSPGEIIAGAEHYRDDWHRKSRPIEYTCHPATWLNAERWLETANEQNNAKYVYSNNPYEN
jgi:hypothetical protein